MELPTPKRDQMLQQLLIALAFALPWAKKALPTLIGVVLVFALFRFFKGKKASMPPRPWPSIGLFSLFMLLVLGITYSEHPDVGLNEIGIKLSFLIFPLLALITPNLRKPDLTWIHQAFVVGCFLFIGITVSHATSVVLQHPDWYYFTYNNLSWYIHPTYAATYQSVALFILMHDGWKKNFILGRVWLHVFAILLILGFVALLSSKAGYLCALVVVFYSAYWAYKQGVRLGHIVIRSGILIALFVSTIMVLPTTSDRVKEAVEEIGVKENTIAQVDSTSPAHTSSTSLRFITWSASWKLLSENPFGAGTGDTQPRLTMLYEQQGEHYASSRQFNAHNQFLQTGAEIGWFGLATLLVILGALWASGREEPTAHLFVLLCALNFMFESFLEVQAGIVFFSFWVLVYSRVER
jgi:hypothetical protein